LHSYLTNDLVRKNKSGTIHEEVKIIQLKLPVMKKNFTPLLFIVLLISCSPRIGYIGSQANPTDKVDVFVDAGAIKKDYDIVGRASLDPAYFANRMQYKQKKILKAVIEEAKSNGADAVWFRESFYYTDGTVINSSTTVDSLQRGIGIRSNTSIVKNPVYKHEEILFLKYK
jgi:hypothetical protein